MCIRDRYYSYLEDSKYEMQFWNPETKTFYWRDDIYNTSYFRENVNSVYAILSENLRALEIQAGVRGEYTHTRLRSSIAGASRDKRRFEGFPSMHLGYTFPRGHRLLVSYSRRTTRPQLFYMEPYITFRDYYTAEIGNPDIRPEYIHSYELTYRKSFRDNNVSATFFHRSRRDKIERLRVPYEAGVTLDSMANVGHDYSTGVELTAVHFASPPYTSELAREKVLKLAEELTPWCGRLAVFIIPFTEIQEEIRRKCPEDHFTLIMRRFMMRLANMLALELRCRALVTGENLGQVASQTMQALAVSEDVTTMPVLRPLIGMDKEEIVKIARHIGTFDTSILPYEDCCTVFTPRHPKTKPSVEETREYESALDVEGLCQRAMAGREMIRIKPTL